MSELGHESFIESIASELRRPVRLDPRFDDRVMEAIEAPEVIPLRPTLPRPWILRPWTISVSPMAMAAAAALMFAVALGVWREGAPTSDVVLAPAVDAPLVPVANVENAPKEHQFLIVVPSAKKLAVVGDFNDWDASRTLMTRVSDEGVWSVTVPLSVGLHQFQFVADDTLRFNDPTLPKTPNGFGSANSVLTVAGGVR